MKRLWLLGLLLPSQAFAFSVELQDDYVMRWGDPDVPILLDSNGTSDISGSADLDAVRDAFASWNNVSCSGLIIDETGTTTDVETIHSNGGYTDDRNVIAWLEDSRWEFGAYVLGVTTPVAYYHGVIEEADVTLNGYSADWTTSDEPTYDTDVESVAVHELGHFFGLQHVLGGENMSDPPTMSPFVDPYLATRTLTQDDKNGACFLYPETSYTCSSASGCPKVMANDYQTGEEYYDGQLTCTEGQCTGFEEVQPGDGQLGESCSDPTSCASGLFCQPVDQSTAFCSEDCDPDAQDCPNGFACYGYEGASGGACLDEDIFGPGPGDDDPPADDCTCDQHTSCDEGCDCDADCDNNDDNADVCICDHLTSCEADCECDVDCHQCSCDETTACDEDCACDPECGDGCAATPTQSAGRGDLALLAGVGLLLVGLRTIRRRG